MQLNSPNQDSITHYKHNLSKLLQNDEFASDHWFYDINLPESVKRSDLENLKKNQRSFILITLPKSGSRYLVDCLYSNFKYPKRKISFGPPTKGEQIIPSFLLRSMQAPCIVQGHPDPTDDNIHLLELFAAKVVVHIRHPAQAIKSLWFHFQKLESERNNRCDSIFLGRYDHYELCGIMRRGQDANQIIHNFTTYWFPKYINWINGWLSYNEIQKSTKLKIHLSTYEDFFEDPKRCFPAMVKFNGNTNVDNLLLPEKSENTHFREGKLNNYSSFFPESTLEFMKTTLKGEASYIYKI